MSELKRCPFCGGEARILTSVFFRSDACVKCKKCGASTLVHSSASNEDAKLNAIKAWNTRKPMDRIVERLEEEAEECRKYWQEFDDEDSFGGMNAYCNAIRIVKEEGGLNEN